MPLREELTELIETDRELARRLLLDLTKAMPNSVEAWSLLALSYMRTLEYPAAIETYDRVLSLDPAHQAALSNKAFACLAHGDNLAALAAYETAFKVLSRVSAANYLAHIQHRLGEMDAAGALYRSILAKAPAESDERLASYRGLASVLRDTGKLHESDGAILNIRQAYAIKPMRTASWLADRAQTQTYHEWLALADKGRLADLIRHGLVGRPGSLRFPETFVLPAQREMLKARAATTRQGELFIIKPNNGSGGQGISVTADLASAADRTDAVVQRYVDRPYLIDGRKGHLRIYILITQAEPLRAYIYREGIVRFAPEPYDPSPERLGDISMHVTNPALHANHPGLTISDDPAKDDEGMIWSLTGFLRRLDRDGGNGQAVFAEIRDLAVGLLNILRDDGVFDRWSRSAPARAYPPKVFGMDVLVDAEGHPWLLEIQASPAVVGSALVNRVNGGMIRSVFEMTVGVLGKDGEPDPTADEIAERELALEMANRGLFEPLPLAKI